MTYSTFLLPNLRVQRCTLTHNYLFASCAPVFQTAMFCHAMAASLNGVCGGVGIVVHGAYPHAEILPGVKSQNGEPGSTFCVSQYRGAAPFGEVYGVKDAKHAPAGVSIQPAFTGDLHISVVMQAKGRINTHNLEEQLCRRRIAGGIIKQHGPIEACASIAEAYAKIRTGYLLVDRSYLLAGGDVIVRYFDVLAEKLPSGRRRTPAGLGYSFLTEEAAVKGSRTGFPHAGVRKTDQGKDVENPENFLHVYAESVSGIVEYVPMRQATEDEKDSLWLTSYIADSVLVVEQHFKHED